MQQHTTAEPPSPYVPGNLARAYHKQRTGEHQIEDISDVTVVDTKQLTPMSPWDKETRREHAVQPAMRRLILPERIQQHLPIGPDGRPFLIACSDLSTGDILKVIVRNFYMIAHVYPDVIYLSSRRWEETGIFTRYFFPDPHSDFSIQLACGSAIESKYDVIARGKEVSRGRHH